MAWLEPAIATVGWLRLVGVKVVSAHVHSADLASAVGAFAASDVLVDGQRRFEG